MAIRVETAGQSDLRVSASASKRNFSAALNFAPFNGDVVGHWRAFFVRLPPGYGSFNQRFAIMGSDSGGTGAFGTSQDWAIRIPGGLAVTTPPTALRLQVQDNSTAAAFAGSQGSIDTIPQLASGFVYLVVTGVTNIGTNADPVWRSFAAVCPEGGRAFSQVAATATSSGFLTSSTQRIFSQVFVRQGSVRTPADTALEEVIYVTGDFPWDTANSRPHHDALQALAASGGHPFLTYEGLLAAQNAGTLPYADSKQGKGRAEYRFTLRNLSSGLTNTGATPGNLIEQGIVGGLANIASIAPLHWHGGVPAITETLDKFIPGRGNRAFTVSGTYPATIINLERRWENMVSGAALPGLDWAPVGVIGGGTWSDTGPVPVGGPYRLRVRDAANLTLETESDDWLSGSRVLLHGQSAMALSTRTGFGGSTLGPNLLGVPVTQGAQGVVMRLNNVYAKGGPNGTYAPPFAVIGRMRSGQAPLLGHGAITFLNEWNTHNPGHPLMICNMAINTHSMASWTANAVIPDGHPTWRFLGPSTPTPPGPADGNASGVVSHYAWLLASYIDVHMIMWNPGMSTTAAARAAYVAAVDARFSNAASAPWLVLPSWRVHRSLPDISAGPSVRNQHISFVFELGSRGILGPAWFDIANDGNGSGHPAFNTSLGVPDAKQTVSDGNYVGQARLGLGFGRALAWAFDRRIKAHGPRIINAWFEDASRTRIHIELGRTLRTLNNAPLHAGAYWVSTDNGNRFVNTGFTAALSTDGTRVVLTSTGLAWPAANVRAEVHWNLPFGPVEMPAETSAEAAFDGLLYDNQTYRGGINLAPHLRPGNPQQGTCRSGSGIAGVPVLSRGPARLMATEKFSGTRTVTVRMMAPDGITVLAEKAITITAI